MELMMDLSQPGPSHQTAAHDCCSHDIPMIHRTPDKAQHYFAQGGQNTLKGMDVPFHSVLQHFGQTDLQIN